MALIEHGLGTESFENRDIVNQGYYVCQPFPCFYHRISPVTVPMVYGIFPQSNICRIDFSGMPAGITDIRYVHLPYKNFQGPLFLFTTDTGYSISMANVNQIRPTFIMRPNCVYGFAKKRSSGYNWSLYLPLPPIPWVITNASGTQQLAAPGLPPNVIIPSRPVREQWTALRLQRS